MLVSKKKYEQLRKNHISAVSEIQFLEAELFKLLKEIDNLKKTNKAPAKKAVAKKTTAKPAKKAGTK